MAADALSQPLGSNKGKQDNQQITILPEATFVWIADADSDNSLESMITDCQNQYKSTMREWEDTYPIRSIETQTQSFWKDINEQRLVIPPKTIHSNDDSCKYGMMASQWDIWAKMKQSDGLITNIIGLVHAHGYKITSKDAPPVNRTKI